MMLRQETVCYFVNERQFFVIYKKFIHIQMLKILYFFFFLVGILNQSLLIETDICRISYEVSGSSINLISCEEKDQCIDGSQGTGSQCAAYSYKQLSPKNCVAICCPEMTVTTLKLLQEIQTCKSQYEGRRGRLIGLTLGLTLGITLILIWIGLSCLYGYQKNPYTGERKWVGYWCCRKAPNFNEVEKKKEEEVEKDGMEEWVETHKKT